MAFQLWYKSKSWPAAAAALLLFAGGCATAEFDPAVAEKKNFDLVASRLDAGGSFYLIHTPDSFKLAAARFIANADEAVWQSGMADDKKRAFRRKLAIGELIWKLSGLERLSAWGCSSVTLKNDPLFKIRNKVYLALEASENIGFDHLLQSEAVAVKPLLAGLPQETDFAFSIYLRPETLLNALKQCGRLGENIASEIPGAIPWNILLQDAGAWWSVAVSIDERAPDDSRSLRIRIECPDRNGRIFEALAAFGVNALRCRSENGRVTTPDTFKELTGIQPRLLKGEGKCIFYSAAEAEELFEAANGRKLADMPDFEALFAGVPAEGQALAYTSGRLPMPETMSAVSLGKLSVQSGDRGSRSVAVLKRDKEGVFLSENGASDLTVNGFYIFLTFLEKLLPENFFSENAPSGTVETQYADSRAADEAGDRLFAECAGAVLPRIGRALLGYAAKNRGQFPDSLAAIIDGNTLKISDLQCGDGDSSYFYFPGSISGNSVIPVVIDRPGSHSGRFNVLYADGTVKSYELERCSSCRRQISFLYTLHRWDENVFKRLMLQAEQFDKGVVTE